MLIQELVRRVFGYVCFSAKDGFSERFLNSASNEKIHIWDVKRKGGTMYARAYIHGYKRIRHSASISGMSLKIEKRVGLPFFIGRYKWRAGLLAGFAVFVAALIYFSSIVWIVEVKGNENIPENEILEVFSELGLRPGASKADIVPDDLQYRAQEKLDGIAWIAVNLSGAVAEIELREVVEIPEIVDKDEICNVVAERDGEILKISALTGKRCVKVGDGVTGGEMLISGIIESQTGNIMYRHAMGSVIARTTRYLTSEIPLRRQEIIYTGNEKQRYSLNIFGFNVKLYFDFFDETWLKSVDESKLEIAQKSFPFAFCSEKFSEYTITEEKLSYVQAVKSAKDEMDELLGKLREDVQIENIEYSLVSDENVLTYTAKCTCIEDIAVQKKIIFEETQEN